MNVKKEGVKHDAGKLRWTLFPFSALEEVLRTLSFGAAEYGDENWKQVPAAKERYLNAAFRHLIEHAKGKKTDPKTGLFHVAHAAANMLFLTYLFLEEEKEEKEEVLYDDER